MAGTPRYSPDVFTRRGGIFLGILLLSVGLMALLGASGLVPINPFIAVGILFVLTGVWLIVTKMYPERFP